MSLSDLKLKKIYRTKQDDVTESFLVPALKESNKYDRGSGYFTLDSLANIADGLIPFIQHGGTVRVVTSVQLSDADVAIINNGLQLQKTTVIEKIHQRIEEDIENEDTLMKLDFITNLIAAGILTIKIAYLPDGIYHEKIGLMTDENGEKLYFSGSNNATVSGLNKNWETIMLLTSWWGDEEEINEQQVYFDHLWDNNLEGLEVMPFPEAEQKNLIRKYKASTDVRAAIQRLQNKSKKRTKKKELYDYQKVAVHQFLENEGNHFYEMATGTGKTFTAIKSIIVRFGATGDEEIEQSPVFRDKTFDIRTLRRNVTVTTIARFPYDFFMPQGARIFLHGINWDYIVIDEASMIPLANIVFPLYKKTPHKFIIAGDPFQIEPITSVELWKNENIYTMVQLDSFTNPKTVPYQYNVELLTTQYRSIPDIGYVFSNFAYGGILKHYRNADSQRPLNVGNDLGVETLNIIKFPVISYFHELKKSIT